jgi:hypothetical protein
MPFMRLHVTLHTVIEELRGERGYSPSLHRSLYGAAHALT